MSRSTAIALVFGVAAFGCVPGDGQPTTVTTASEDGELRAARDRIARLEADLARDELREDVAESSHATKWEGQPVPRKFRAAASAFRNADKLLFSLVDHLVDLRSEDAGVSVTVRARDDGENFLGEIALDGYLDDSVRGHEFRVSLRRDGDAWHVKKLLRRQRCWRGGGPDGCV